MMVSPKEKARKNVLCQKTLKYPKGNGASNRSTLDVSHLPANFHIGVRVTFNECMLQYLPAIVKGIHLPISIGSLPLLAVCCHRTNKINGETTKKVLLKNSTIMGKSVRLLLAAYIEKNTVFTVRLAVIKKVDQHKGYSEQKWLSSLCEDEIIIMLQYMPVKAPVKAIRIQVSSQECKAAGMLL